jgi:hypothetical protein
VFTDAMTVGQPPPIFVVSRVNLVLIESNLKNIASQLAQRPTRGDLAKTALGIIFCSAILTTLFVWIAWH